MLTYLEIRLTEQFARLKILRININVWGRLSFCDFLLTQINKILILFLYIFKNKSLNKIFLGIKIIKV